MSVRRPVAAALLAAAALSLTACSSAGTPAAAGSAAAPASATAPAAAAPATSATAVSPSAKATTSAASTAGKQSAKPSPAADCTAAAQPPNGHRVISATVAWGSPDRIGADKTRFVCGDDVPGEGHWESVPGSDETLYFAPGATAQLLVGTQPKDVPPARLMQQIVACSTDNKTSQGEYGCYGNLYEITTDGSGKITKIVSLYHP
ncbi:hypothetical protein AB0O31_22235 [Kitasatospora cineracea]|uniref:hypothetical protein n=1 Tax=Kitasatospora cineracea TaxID=88074 RepID=UPI003433B955